MTGDPLTAEQVNAGIVTLAGYSGKPFTDEDRAAWRNVLRTTYRSGELAEALDKWQRGPKGGIRPDPSDLSQFLPGPKRPMLPSDINAPKRTAPDHETFEEEVDRWKSETFGDDLPRTGAEWIEAFHDKCHVPKKYRKEDSK